jgi:glycosyltransferase involved in cell wall biosynthesis
MKDLTIVITTYGQRLESKHNMLPDILESLKALKEKGFRVIVINNTPKKTYHKKIRVLIEEIVKPYRKHFRIEPFGYQELQKLHSFFTLNGYGDFLETTVFGGYASFRNIGLLIANILGSEAILFLDDDEIIEDKDFLKKATEFIGKRHKGKVLGGVAGYYITRNGSYLLPTSEMERWWSVFWNKTKYMNEAFKVIGSSQRLNETNVAFGGNMVLHEKLYSTVPFDPFVPRGEDIDLLITAKAYGFAFLLDNQLAIKHLHPPRTHSEWWRDFRWEAYRFVYEREKVLEFIKEGKLQKDAMKQLDPYPGHFLKKGMYLNFIATSFLLALDSLLSLKFKAVAENLRNIRIVLFDARKKGLQNCRKYLEFQRRWVQMVRDIKEDKELVSFFKKRFV